MIEPIFQSGASGYYALRGCTLSSYLDSHFKSFQKELRGRKDRSIFRTAVTERLSSGFAEPNGGIYWTALFSELSTELSLAVLDWWIEWRGPRTHLGSIDEQKKWLRRDNTDQQLQVKACHRLTYLPENNDVPSWVRQIDIVNVGVTDARDYTSLRAACDIALSLQGVCDPIVRWTDRTIPSREQIAQLADPETLNNNWNEYIDALVRANNEIQHYARYCREMVCNAELEFMRAMKPTDEELERIAQASPCVMFCMQKTGKTTSKDDMRV